MYLCTSYSPRFAPVPQWAPHAPEFDECVRFDRLPPILVAIQVKHGGAPLAYLMGSRSKLALGAPLLLFIASNHGQTPIIILQHHVMARVPADRRDGATFIGRDIDIVAEEKVILASSMPAAARAHHQLGFGSGGYTGTAGTKPLRFGISTFGRLLASMTSVSLMMPFRYNRNATTA